MGEWNVSGEREGLTKSKRRKRMKMVTQLLILMLLWSSVALMLGTGDAIQANEHKAKVGPARDIHLKIHYHRFDGDYKPWDLWVWPAEGEGQAYPFTYEDEFGKVAEITIPKVNVDRIGFLVRTNKWEKDVEEDRFIQIPFTQNHAEIWLYQGFSNVFMSNPQGEVKPEITQATIDSFQLITLKTNIPFDLDQDANGGIRINGGKVKIQSVHSSIPTKGNVTNQVRIVTEKPLDLKKEYSISHPLFDAVQLEKGTINLDPLTAPTIEGSSVTFPLAEGNIQLRVCDQGVAKVQFIPPNQEETRTPVVANTDCSTKKVSITKSKNEIKIKTEKMTLVIDSLSRSLTVFEKKKLILKNMDLLSMVDGKALFLHSKDDLFYGLSGYNASESSVKGMVREAGGEIKAGEQGGAGAPFLWSTSGYGFLLNTVEGEFQQSESLLSFQTTSQPDLQYYLILGNPIEIQEKVAFLSGKSPMFPKWSLGFIHSEWGIDQEELEGLVQIYRQKSIPIDVFTLDFDWKDWSKDQYGEFRWNLEKFPDGPTGRLKQWMDERGIKLTGIMKPRIHVNTEQGRYATEHGYWWPGKEHYEDYFSRQLVNDLNFALPEVREWYYNEHTRHSFDTGIVGWWNDEADAGYDNVQFMNMQKSLYDGQRAHSPLRVWSINRNFFLGAQRYAYSMWSGDIGTGFRSMESQPAKMLSAINLGQMKWGMDTGGFHGTPDPENYARWMQFSAFTPVFRVHGALNEQRQPWVYGQQAEEVAKEAIELRYRLIPYMYAYERQAYETGIGLVKPLVYDYPNDPKVANEVKSWMFGDYILVSPVLVAGQSMKPIYLPEGTWIDFFRGDTIKGGQTIQYSIDHESWKDIPLFIKKGSIIPSQEVMNYIGEKPVETIDVDVFPDKKKASFIYYDDDGKTYDYEKGAFFKQVMSTYQNGEQTVFEVKKAEGSYQPELKYYMVKIHGKFEGREIQPRLNGTTPKKFDSVERLAQVEGEGWTSSKDRYGDVILLKIKAGEEQEVTIGQPTIWSLGNPALWGVMIGLGMVLLLMFRIRLKRREGHTA